MKFLSDFFPVLLFFAVYFLAGQSPDTAQALASQTLSSLTRDGQVPPDLAPIMLATAVAILAISLQILVMLLLRKRVGPAQWISFGIFLVFGSATIYFHSDTFIKWKPTALYWLFALILFVGQTFYKTNFIRKLMGASGLELPEPVWLQLNHAWALFFAVVGALNLYIAFHFSRDVWVSFKSFGLTALTLVFALVMSVYLARHVSEERKDMTKDEAAKP